MQNERHVRAIDDEQVLEREDIDDTASADVVDEHEWEEEQTLPVARANWVLPTAVILLVLGWTAAFVYVNRLPMAAGAGLGQWIDWIASWSTPVLLVTLAWLLFARLSRKEAARFGDAAQALARESEQLELRLHSVNRELSLAREFLSSQTLELESLGRMAGERISTNADRLQGLISENGEQVDRIARVSDTALDNMARLRDDLPVIANSARDVSNKIGAAGREAEGQLHELVSGFERLNTFGTASERQVETLRERTETVLATLEDRLAGVQGRIEQRFAAIEAEHEASAEALDEREVRALAGIRGRAEAVRSELEAATLDLEAQENAALEALHQRVRTVREEADAIADRLSEAQHATGAEWNDQTERLQKRLEKVVGDVADIERRTIAAMREKLEALSAESAAVDEQIVQRETLFEQRLVGRRDALQREEDNATTRMETRTAALEAILVKLSQQSEQIEHGFRQREATFIEGLAARRLAMSESEQEMLVELEARLNEVEEVLAKKREAQAAQLEAMAAKGLAIGVQVEAMSEHMTDIGDKGRQAAAALTADVERIDALLSNSDEQVGSTHEAVMSLTDSTVRLLELIQASAKHAKDELPTAIDGFEAVLSDVETRSGSLEDRFSQLITQGKTLDAGVEKAAEGAVAAREQVESLAERYAQTNVAQDEHLETIGARLEVIAKRNAAVAEEARAQLDAALAALEEKSRAALGQIEELQAERISSLAHSIGSQAGAAIDEALDARMAAALAALDEATANAETTGRETAKQLRDQLSRVNELTSNLEARVQRAREQAEESVDNDFSRRAALITDSLNSAAIDIGKAISSDVSDTAWASYMKGDRGIFSRRAVRLLESTTARDIAELYDADADFRENVSRFIHDFEAMLRMLLSTRDGQPLGVTVLGSDVGKLYVALAQAIERLRE